MYIPNNNLTTDKDEIVAFMKQFSFATIVTAKDSFPIATHLPFLVTRQDDIVTLTSHFAKANEQWQHIETVESLIIFSQPHAYISTKNYDSSLNVPTWNYISVHAYGTASIITDPAKNIQILEATIDNYEKSYRQDWDAFPEKYKLNMIKGIVSFQIEVRDLQAKKKLSQNRTFTEKQKIVDTLSMSNDSNEQLIAAFMKQL